MKPKDDLCDECGYHLILKKVIDITDMKRPNQATGFERILQEHLHETETSQGTLLWMKVVGGLLLVAAMFLCLGPWWWLGVLAVGAGVGYWWMRHRRRAAGMPQDSAVNQDPLSVLLWSALLAVQRVAGWRKLEWPLPRAVALTLSDPQFNDDELGELSGLSNIEALDLEGTGITDGGLQYLRDQKQLRYLVIRGTQVTPAGAAGLQRDLPAALIWH